VKIEASKAPELVIAIVGPMGTDINKVQQYIDSSLAKSDYLREEIRVSSFIKEFPGYQDIEEQQYDSEGDRLTKYMKAGTEIRKSQHEHGLGEGDILARMVLARIRDFRLKQDEGGPQPDEECPQPLENTAFIINSLKHPAEVDLLREIFKDRFFVISAYQPKSTRIYKLAKKIALSLKTSNWEEHRARAEKLINTDEREEGEELGQNASQAFQRGDYFVDLDDDLEKEIDRFFNILFGKPFVSPKLAEMFMLQATSVACVSADLSRQVGAVITSEDGEIIAQGFNEVPRAGGGTNWDDEDEKNDRRDYTIDIDPNALLRDEAVQEVFSVLAKNGLLAQGAANRSPSDLAIESLYGEKPLLKNKRIANILEFGRVVHAEMNALSQAAMNGRSVKNAVLYCTTFPCHGCARHILAAGIKKVVYIEPYPKSIAKQLYGDMIRSDGEPGCNPNALQFQAFTGLSPDNYFRFFSKGKRKESQGKAFDNVRQKLPVGIDLSVNHDCWKENQVILPIMTLFEKMKLDGDSN